MKAKRIVTIIIITVIALVAVLTSCTRMPPSFAEEMRNSSVPKTDSVKVLINRVAGIKNIRIKDSYVACWDTLDTNPTIKVCILSEEGQIANYEVTCRDSEGQIINGPLVSALGSGMNRIILSNGEEIDLFDYFTTANIYYYSDEMIEMIEFNL